MKSRRLILLRHQRAGSAALRGGRSRRRRGLRMQADADMNIRGDTSLLVAADYATEPGHN